MGFFSVIVSLSPIGFWQYWSVLFFPLGLDDPFSFCDPCTNGVDASQFQLNSIKGTELILTSYVVW
jgi:hypothetical protein